MTAEWQRARFPAVPASDGHYESFYLKVSDPRQPRGAWIRYTVLKRPDGPSRGSLWCTVWPPDGGGPQARKVTLDPAELSTGDSDLIRIGASRFMSGEAAGSIDGAEWELRYSADAAELPYLPRPWMYRSALPRTKAVSLAPHAEFHGRITVGEHTLAVDGWPGMAGHNWGAEHAERWVWIHGAGFPEAPDAWLDMTIGRIKVGPLTLPWVANGGLFLDGRLRRLGGPAAIRATSVSEAPGRCRFTVRGGGVTVAGELEAPEAATVAWEYADPTGGRHFTRNCSVAALNLSVRSGDGSARRLALPAGAAYELGAREAPASIPVQPFPDP